MKYYSVRNNLETFYEAARGKRVILFGTGDLAYQLLNNLSIDISCICDDNAELWGTKLYGIDIVSPDILSRDTNTIILNARHRVWSALKIIHTFGDFPVYTGRVLLDDFLSQTATLLFDNKDKLDEVHNMLFDDISKKIFSELVYRNMAGGLDFSDLLIMGDHVYISLDRFRDSPPANEILIDCGAYDGDSAMEFIRVYGNSLQKIYAFEPCEHSFKAFEKNVRRWQENLKYLPEIIIRPEGLNDKTEACFFNTTESCRSASYIAGRRPAHHMFNAGSRDGWNYDRGTIQTVRLDDVIPADEKITIIKMDIEGAEQKALLGAKRIITTHKPRLAICIYHRGDDYFRIPLLLKKFVPEYNFAVRHHKKSRTESVLYAWV